MADDGDISHPKNIHPEQAYDIHQVLVELLEHVRQLTHEDGQVKESAQ